MVRAVRLANHAWTRIIAVPAPRRVGAPYWGLYSANPRVVRLHLRDWGAQRLLSREAAARQALLGTGETDLRAGLTRRHRTYHCNGNLASGHMSADFRRVRTLRLETRRVTLQEAGAEVNRLTSRAGDGARRRGYLADVRQRHATRRSAEGHRLKVPANNLRETLAPRALTTRLITKCTHIGRLAGVRSAKSGDGVFARYRMRVDARRDFRCAT